MPFSALNALPRKIGTELLEPGPLRRRLETVEFARNVTVAAAVHLGWLVFHWARQLYGPPSGLLALTLFVFDPNIHAHAGLVTTDLYAAWMITLTVWSFWRLLNHRGPGVWRVATVGALLFGLAQLAKYTSAYLVPILVLIALGHAAPELWSLVHAARPVACADRSDRDGLEVCGALCRGVPRRRERCHWGQDTFTPVAEREFRSGPFWNRPGGPRTRAGSPGPGAVGVRRGPGLGARDERRALERVPAGPTRQERRGRSALPRVLRDRVALQGAHRDPAPAGPGARPYVLRFRRFDFRRNEWPARVPGSILRVVLHVRVHGHRSDTGMPSWCCPWCSSSRAASCVTPGRGAAVPGADRRPAALPGRLRAVVLSALHSLLQQLFWDRTKAYKILADSNLGWEQNQRYVRRYLRAAPRDRGGAACADGGYDPRASGVLCRAVLPGESFAGSGRTSSPSTTSATGTCSSGSPPRRSSG